MYKKPQTEKVTLQPNGGNMAGTLGVSNGGGDNESHNGMTAGAPRRSL